MQQIESYYDNYSEEQAPKPKNNKNLIIIAIIAIIIVIGIFTYAAGWWGAGTTLPSWLSWLSDPGTISVIVIVLVFIIVIGYVTADDTGKKDDGTFKKFREGLGELFGGS